jgi:hypothetical protein
MLICATCAQGILKIVISTGKYTVIMKKTVISDSPKQTQLVAA